jgi:hypothetical protein
MSRFRQENTENRWNMGAVFRLENFRIFLDAFRPEYCFHIPGISNVFPYLSWGIR